jgi:hypothetical protein
VHFVKSDRLLSENSPWMTTDALGFWINSIYPSNSDLKILELANARRTKISDRSHGLNLNSVGDAV